MTGIYYSDLFVINNIGCLIMGYGKSITCRSFTGDSTKEICTDSIRLEKTKEGDKNEEKNEWIELSDFNITYGVSDEKKRRDEFRVLIEDIKLKCIIVPWCEDIQTKGKMISYYIK